MMSSQSPRRSPIWAIGVALFILAIAAVTALPNYVTQQWSWNNPPDVPNLTQIKALREQGLTIPGWETLSQEQVEIGGHKWSIQTIRADQPVPEASPEAPVIVLLRPQSWYRDQPQVDWMDINGVYRWKADSRRTLEFAVEPTQATTSDTPEQPTGVKARFLRGWNPERTYAVLQWYAWTTGGNAAPSQWFWVDQLTQWRDRHRMPWVAVSVLIPIKPLGSIDTAESLATSLGQAIQTTLVNHVFNSN